MQNINNKVKFSKILVVLALVTSSLTIYAEEKVVTEEDIDRAIERINARINAMPVVEEDYPRFTRVALDYSRIDGNVHDQRATNLFGGPYSDGQSDADIFRLSTNIQLSKNFSAGLSVSSIDGKSKINQGETPTNNTIHSDSDGNGYAASLRYQINDWLAAGAFVGWSSGDGN